MYQTSREGISQTEHYASSQVKEMIKTVLILRSYIELLAYLNGSFLFSHVMVRLSKLRRRLHFPRKLSSPVH